ncbi:ABC transporter permease [Streptomyces sp. NPDC054783]
MGVNRDPGQLFLLLAAVGPVIGAAGIANTNLVAVPERTGETGQRRALGARSRHILAQFLDATGRTSPKKASARAFTAS